jgi:hypothetical protein
LKEKKEKFSGRDSFVEALAKPCWMATGGHLNAFLGNGACSFTAIVMIPLEAGEGRTVSAI